MRGLRVMSGFTLVEVLVVVTLLGILGVAAVNMFFSTLLGGGKASVIATVKQQGEYALANMERTIRSGKNIDSCAVNEIRLTLLDGREVGFLTQGEKIVMQTEAQAPVGLTGSDVVIEDVNFECSLSEVQPDSVTISFVVRSGDPQIDRAVDSYSQEFRTRVVLRNY